MDYRSHSKMSWTGCKNNKKIALLDMDDMSEQCNSYVLVLKVNGKVTLCLDPVRLKMVLIRLVHRGLTLNDILTSLPGVKYLTLIDESLGYHNLKLDEQSLHLTTFSCPFGKYS